MLTAHASHFGNEVYPGQFTPLFSEEEMIMLLNNKLNKDVCHPPVNMIELPNFYLLEVSIPGVNREDFLICVNENILSIYVVHAEFEDKGMPTYRMHEFKNEYFDRHLVLPDKIQIEFITAEYRDGILKIRIPKSNEKSPDLKVKVAVY